MPSAAAQTHQELYVVGSNKMQVLDLSTGATLSTTNKTMAADGVTPTGGWDCLIVWNNATFHAANRWAAATYIMQNATDPSKPAVTTFCPDLSMFGDD